MSPSELNEAELKAQRERFAVELRIVNERIDQLQREENTGEVAKLYEQKIVLENSIENVDKKLEQIKEREPYESQTYEVSAQFADPSKVEEPVRAEMPGIDLEQQRRDAAILEAIEKQQERGEIVQHRFDGLDNTQEAVKSIQELVKQQRDDLGNKDTQGKTGQEKTTIAEIGITPKTVLDVLPPSMETIAIQAAIGALAVAEVVKQGVDHVLTSEQRVEELINKNPAPSKENIEENKLLGATEKDIQEVAAQEKTIFEQRQQALAEQEQRIREQREAEERERARLREIMERDGRG
ncbi:MAG TPA: hypothetical protein VGK97_11730 [Spongiibacteraceae bacterium]|jgi:hypothetical protein